ncbi:MAG: transcription factor S [Candidatus Methanoliparum thermophilum]|uniref:Transcription factor S n=1 Tax=Methanoliparum thermophilum TaxID=2491083 RepID=A0A520KSR2_METT2|nr:transcription factor S [Candidatus Methanoliparum sp. LAM-1]RZN64959.1 MAG: transcription factor S [Candidatus Methanoliparum thermophilum]BDC36158.1 DNA-directed RNA polymerase subunit M [Candidatus Methanoliparum sp. LAM-1]
MKFCPKCKSIMLPVDNNKMVCRNCGYEIDSDRAETTDNMIIKEKKKDDNITILEEQSEGILPVIEVKCPECGNNKAYWWLRQLRSADESEVRFFRCTKCGKTWREYN